MSLRRSNRIQQKKNSDNEVLKNNTVENNISENSTKTTTTARKRKTANKATTTKIKSKRVKKAALDRENETKEESTVKNKRPYKKKTKSLDPENKIETAQQDNTETGSSSNDNKNNNNNDINNNNEPTIELVENENDINNKLDHYDEDHYNEEDESQRFIKLLSAAIDLQSINTLPTESFTRNKRVIEEALQVNEKLQRLIEDKIEKIDHRLEENDGLSKIARLLSIREARVRRDKIDIHRPYTTTTNRFDYFKEFHGVELSENEENQENTIDVERSRAWQTKERELLSTAIQTEVQRITAYGHLSRNEAWRVWEVDNIPKKEWENFPVNKLDWNRISTLYVKTRTPMECMIQWTTQDHPAINKTPWSKKESEKLGQLVKEYGYEGQWEKIASQLNTNRTASQCFSHYQAEFNALNAKRPWTKEDDEALKEAVTLVGDKNWQQVAAIIGGRSGQQCLHRWEKSINPAIRRSRWTEEEDNALRGAVDVYGVGNWTSVQRHIPGRTDMQCRERWMNCLDPRINHGAFTEEENQKLKEIVEKYGKRWSFLTQFMPGRTDNHLLRQWKAFQKPPGKKGRQKKQENESGSTTEAVEETTTN